MKRTPLMLAQVDQLVRDKLELALANRGREVNVLVGVSKVEMEAMMAQLRAMREGFKRFHSPDNELNQLARSGYIKFGKDFDPHAPSRKRFNVYMVVYSLADLRPSAAFDQAIADYQKGLRSSPF